MNRALIAVFAALEALLVVGVGVGIPLVPLTVMWAVQYGLQIDWFVFWRASVDLWLIGHGADARFSLDPAVAAATGLPGAGEVILVTIAPLGFALLTLLLGVRAGRRIGETPHHHLGALVSIATAGMLALLLSLSAVHPDARPSLVQGTLFPTLVFALGIAIGSRISRGRLRRAVGEAPPDGMRRLVVERLPAGALTRATPALRALRLALTGGAAATALIASVSAVAVAVLLATQYGRIIGLYEGVQSGVLGGAALTLGQLALIPNLIIWAIAWFVGPGFAVGVSSTVSPLGTALGPLPAVPVLGALPSGDLAFGFVGLLVPVLAGFLTGVVLRPRLVRSGLGAPGWLVGVGLGTGIIAGAMIGALAWISSGAAGPGRLAEVGPAWLPVALWSALEVGLPAALALLIARPRAESAEVEPERELVTTGA